MAYLLKIGKWFLRALGFLLPYVSTMFYSSLYVAAATALYVIVNETAEVIRGVQVIFAGWADNLSVSIVEFFEGVYEHTLFQFLSYILSLDVALDWFRYCADSFIRFWLLYAVGFLLAVVEACVLILGVYWIRKRVKVMAAGLDGGNGGGTSV